MAKRETSAEIDAVAARWAVRVDDAPLAADAQAELDAWLAGDARRLGAFARARAMFLHAHRVKALGPNFDPNAFLAQHRANSGDTVFLSAPLASASSAKPLVASDDYFDVEEARPSRRRFLWLGGSAAAAAATGYFAFVLPAAAQTYSTKRGEVRLVPLADGSSMTLNTGSTAKVTYGDDERRVELVAGEALFDVVKDSRRPFVVVAGETSVRALGTSFSVTRIVGTPVTVMVRQGVVEVTQPLQPQAAPQQLVANTQATAAANASIVTRELPPDEVMRTLAWREGMLSFEDMPLSQAAAQFARYSDTRIRFADPALGSETITGMFAANNPAGFAKAVATTLDLRAEATPDGILLRR